MISRSMRSSPTLPGASVSSGYGDRARVGHLYPSGGLCDYELQLMAPQGVQFLTTRMPFRATGIADDLAIASDLEAHASLLADAEVDLVAFNCTAASMLLGPDAIRDRIRVATGLSCVTTIEAVLGALDALGIDSPALLDPYPKEVEDAEIEYLASHGIRVVATGGPACDTPVQQGRISPECWVAESRAIDLSEANGILVSCAGTQSAQAIAQIEADTGLPVVTSNQALLWQVLTEVGLDDLVQGFGILLDRPRAGFKV